MKARHLKIVRCKCGERFVKLTQAGSWYWCLWCDAHITGCKAKGSPAVCICQKIAA